MADIDNLIGKIGQTNDKLDTLVTLLNNQKQSTTSGGGNNNYRPTRSAMGNYYGDDLLKQRDSILKEQKKLSADLDSKSRVFKGIFSDIKDAKRDLQEASDAIKDAIDEEKDARDKLSLAEAEYGQTAEEAAKKIKEASEEYRNAAKEFEKATQKVSSLGEKQADFMRDIRELADKGEDAAKDVKAISEEYGVSEDIIEEILKKYDDLNKSAEKRKDLEETSGKVLAAQNKTLKEQNQILIEEERHSQKMAQMRQEGWAKIKKGFNEVKGVAKDFLDAFGKVDAAASKFARTLGMSGAGRDAIRKSAINAVASKNLGLNYGVSASDLIEIQGNYANSIGRRVNILPNELEDAAALNKVMGSDQAGEMAARLENFGLSYGDAAKRAETMFKKAGKYGLSFEKYSQNFVKNLSMAQNYTFKNGLKGLESMAKKATQIKLDMSQIQNFADNVSTVEGAVNTGAQLQVLGGPFAAMSNPLGMLSEGLTDMEGLMDRFTSMTGGLGKFNAQTGEMDISSFNKQRIKAAAKAMGMDPSQVMESVMAQGKQNYIKKQLGDRYDETTRELLTNTATVKNGKATVALTNAKGETYEKNIATDTLTPQELEQLRAQNQTEGEDIKSIAKQLRSWDDYITGAKQQVENKEAQLTEKSGVVPELERGIDKIFGNDKLVTGYVAVTEGFKTVEGLLDIIKGTVIGIMGLMGAQTVGGFLGRRGGRAFGKTASKTAQKAAKKGGRNIGNAFGLGRNGTWERGSKLIKSSTGKKFIQTADGKIINKAGNVISGAPAKKIMQNGQVLRKVGANSLKVAKGANVLGWAGLAGDLATDWAINSGKMKKGGTANYAARMGSGAAGGAAMGAMIGSIVPGIGNVVGGAVGAAVGAINGAIKATADKRIGDIEKQTGIKVQGSYGARRAKKIKKALESGDIDEKTRRKMEKMGDNELLAQIDKKKEERIAEANMTAGRMDATIQNATLTFNGSGMSNGGLIRGYSNGGGISGPDTVPAMLAQGEAVIPRPAVAAEPQTVKHLIGDYGGDISGFKGMSNGGMITPRPQHFSNGVLHVKDRPSHYRDASLTETMNLGPLKLDISGKITLDGGSGMGVDITDELLKSRTFIRKITRLIEEQIGQNNRGGNVTQKGSY